MAVKRMGKGFDTDAYTAHKEQTNADAYVVTYEGAVLGLYEQNGYHDSDFFAVVWDDERQTVTSVQYGTTRGWTYPNTAWVDVTDENLAKAREWLRKTLLDSYRRRNFEDARTAKVGRKVRVIKKKGGKWAVAEGEEGYVAAVKDGRAFDYRTAKYGVVVNDLVLQVGDRLAYIAADRVEVLDAEQYETDDAELVERAATVAARATAGDIVSRYRGQAYELLSDRTRKSGFAGSQQTLKDKEQV